MVGRQDRARSGAFAVAARSGSRQTLKLTWRRNASLRPISAVLELEPPYLATPTSERPDTGTQFAIKAVPPNKALQQTGCAGR
jgi:hypothetical protein